MRNRRDVPFAIAAFGIAVKGVFVESATVVAARKDKFGAFHGAAQVSKNEIDRSVRVHLVEKQTGIFSAVVFVADGAPVVAAALKSQFGAEKRKGIASIAIHRSENLSVGDFDERVRGDVYVCDVCRIAVRRRNASVKPVCGIAESETLDGRFSALRSNPNEIFAKSICKTKRDKRQHTRFIHKNSFKDSRQILSILFGFCQ